MQWILQDIPIGRNIQAIRIEKKLTHEDLESKLQLMGSNMSSSTLANIEVGRRNIKASDLRALKTLFDVDYDMFFKIYHRFGLSSIVIEDDKKPRALPPGT